ncbi:MAG: methyltransferase domain-containing protein [Rhodothermales bacterium]
MRRRDTTLTEFMDQPDCDPDRLVATFRSFGSVNRLLSGWNRVYRREIRPILRSMPAGGPVTLLDVGCGGGDVLHALVFRARREGYDVQGTGVDPDPRAIAFARDRGLEGIRFVEGRLEDTDLEADIVISNHVLHHLSDPEVAGLLVLSRERARSAVIHNDIARSRTALVLFQLLRPFYPGSFICADGTRSIRRSFRPAELKELARQAVKASKADGGWRLLRAGPFRTGLVWTARSEAAQ